MYRQMLQFDNGMCRGAMNNKGFGPLVVDVVY